MTDDVWAETSIIEDEFEDFFGAIDGSEEDEAGQETSIYIPPANNSWVPVKITASRVRHTLDDDDDAPEWAFWRKPKKVCVAYGKDGKRSATWAGIQKILDEGGREEVKEIPLTWFEVEARHVIKQYQNKPFPYIITTPTLELKIPYREPRKDDTGWRDSSGFDLRKATGVSLAGKKVDRALLEEVVQEMDDRIIMVQIEVKMKPGKNVLRLDDQGQPIIAQADPVTGDMVKVVKDGDKITFAEDGTVYEGPTEDLIPLGEDAFTIRAGESDAGVPVMDPGPPQLRDYVKAGKIKSVPERAVSFERTDGTTAEGEITWDTVGNIVARRLTPGESKVEVLLKETGELVPLVWMGTQWIEEVQRPVKDDIPF